STTANAAAVLYAPNCAAPSTRAATTTEPSMNSRGSTYASRSDNALCSTRRTPAGPGTAGGGGAGSAAGRPAAPAGVLIQLLVPAAPRGSSARGCARPRAASGCARTPARVAHAPG